MGLLFLGMFKMPFGTQLEILTLVLGLRCLLDATWIYKIRVQRKRSGSQV